MAPANLKYAKTHEWLSLNGDVGTIGISDFAVKELTDLVYMGLPNVGKKLNAGEVFGEIESVKAVSDLYAPVSGEVIEVNSNLPNDLDLLSKDAFGKGWLIKVRLSNPAEAASLLDAAAYEHHCIFPFGCPVGTPSENAAGVTPAREAISEEVRIAVWRRDDGKCVKCGSREKLEYDHIVPVSKGGSNTVRNVELLCERCNRSKGAKIQ